MTEFEGFDKTRQHSNIGISSNWLTYGDYMQKQDFELLLKILHRHLFSWWD